MSTLSQKISETKLMETTINSLLHFTSATRSMTRPLALDWMTASNSPVGRGGRRGELESPSLWH